jgi:hypothetical protein
MMSASFVPHPARTPPRGGGQTHVQRPHDRVTAAASQGPHVPWITKCRQHGETKGGRGRCARARVQERRGLGLTLERLAELLAVVGDGRDGGGDLERRHRRWWLGVGSRDRGLGGSGMRVRAEVDGVVKIMRGNGGDGCDGWRQRQATRRWVRKTMGKISNFSTLSLTSH